MTRRRQQAALPGLAETGFALVPQTDDLAQRREAAREAAQAAARSAEFHAAQEVLHVLAAAHCKGSHCMHA